MSSAISLGDHFTYKRLIRFTLPSVVMMVATSFYTIVDGFFISNFVGKEAFAAVNLIWPYLQLVSAPGFMIGAGGSALVSLRLGEKKDEEANRIFSMLMEAVVIFGLLVSAVSFIIMKPLAIRLGADASLLPDCVLYGRIYVLATVFLLLQLSYQSLFVTAEKPRLGLWMALAAGIANMVLDALLVYVFHLGIRGAALASALSQLVGGVAPTVYFLRRNSSRLRLVRARLRLKPIIKSCSNGASEMMTNLSGAVIGVLFNFQLLRLAGNNGVAAYGAILYVAFIFQAIYFGYSMNITSVIGFHYGAGNHVELRNVLKKSLVITGTVGVIMAVLSQAMAPAIADIFVGYDAQLRQMTLTALRWFSISFLLSGFNIFASAFFTGLNNGRISALISFLRTLVIQAAAVYLLPLVLGLRGVWLAESVAEAVTLVLSAVLFVSQSGRYGYGKRAVRKRREVY